MVVRNQVNILLQVLRNWFMMQCKKQSSDIISSSRLKNIMCGAGTVVKL